MFPTPQETRDERILALLRDIDRSLWLTNTLLAGLFLREFGPTPDRNNIQRVFEEARHFVSEHRPEFNGVHRI